MFDSIAYLGYGSLKAEVVNSKYTRLNKEM